MPVVTILQYYPQRPFDYEFVFHSQKKLKFPDAIIEPQSDI